MLAFLRRFPRQRGRSWRFTLTTPTHEVVHWCNPRFWIAGSRWEYAFRRECNAHKPHCWINFDLVRYLQSAIENLKLQMSLFP